MTSTPAWQAATAGQPPRAAHVNQLLGTHAVQLLYTGVQTAASTTAGTTSTSTNGAWLAQSFMTAAGQTAIGYVGVPLHTTTASGASLAPTTLSLYADAPGAPAGSPLATVTLTAEYAFTSGGLGAFAIYPLPVTGLTPSTTYWLVSPAAGSGSASYTWYRSTAGSGAMTSATGTSWTAAGYGLLYQVCDQTPTGPLTATWEDGGARWTVQSVNASGQPATLGEYTAGQTAGGYLQSVRALTYSSNALIGVS